MLTAIFDTDSINPLDISFAAAQWADGGNSSDLAGNNLKIVVDDDGFGNSAISIDVSDIYLSENTVLSESSFTLVTDESSLALKAVSDDGSITIDLSNSNFTSGDLNFIDQLDALTSGPDDTGGETG